MKESKRGWLDRLPAKVRHIIIGVALTFFGTIALAIKEAGSVIHLAWGTTLQTAFDTSLVGGVLVFITLYVTPLTNQYGFGKTNKEPKI